MTVHFQDLPEAARRELATSVRETVASAGFYETYVKRVFDVAVVLITLPITLPVIAVFALLVGLDGSNPFYAQKRVGRHGRVFTIFKLRSMVPDADRLLQAHIAENPAALEEWETTQKLKSDPRITRLGRFIRKSSIDELPQVLNVLWGDMSLVGPRPILVSQVPLYPGSAYYDMRPGITGLWQISDRNECAFQQRAAYDTIYHARISFATDMRILGSTVGVVLRCTGY